MLKNFFEYYCYWLLLELNGVNGVFFVSWRYFLLEFGGKEGGVGGGGESSKESEGDF